MSGNIKDAAVANRFADGGAEAKAGRSGHWENAWQRGIDRGAAFDNNAPSKALQDWLRRTKAGGAAATVQGTRKPTALVPGCGRGYDVLALAAAGYEATGLDLAPTAVEEANRFFGTIAADDPLHAGVGSATVKAADFFEYTAPAFDVIYDVTFLCAIHPDARARWAAKMKELLRPGGELVTLIFPICNKPSGPPYAMSPSLVEGLVLPEGFENVEMVNPLPPDLRHLANNIQAGSALAVWKRAE